MFCVALVSYKVISISKINDPSAKYENLENELKIRRFRLSTSSVMVVGNGKDLKIIYIRCNDVIGG